MEIQIAGHRSECVCAPNMAEVRKEAQGVVEVRSQYATEVYPAILQCARYSVDLKLFDFELYCTKPEQYEANIEVIFICQ